MKVDKELLVKQHFWVLLAAYTPMVFLALVLLWTSVAAAIDKKADEIKKLKEKVAAASKNARNTYWIDAMGEKAQKLADQKNKVWNNVWIGQSGMFSWPQGLVAAYPTLAQMDYGEELSTPDLRDKYVNDLKWSYRKQLDDLVTVVQPVDSKGEGVVQFQGGDWKNVVHYVPKWIGRESQSVPSSQEIWLAQEDYWVQRELLQVVRDTNDGVAIYEKAPEAPKLAAGEIDRQIFVNPRWKLDITLERNQIRWQITNRTARHQQLGGLKFRLKLQQATHELFVDGEPLGPNQTSKVGFDKKFKSFQGLRGIDAVEQILDWKTAPIKRIDKIALAQHAHSTIGQALLPFPGFVTEAEKEAATASPAPAGPNGPGANAMRAPPPMGPNGPAGPYGPGARTSAGNELGLEKNRYLDVSPQVRRMPIGMVMVVDQAYTQDVLATFAKSRLRFQITQVEWKRYRGSIQPPLLDDGPEGPRPVRPGIATVPRPPVVPVRPVGPMGPMGPMGRPMIRPDAAQDADNEEDSSNLVELAVYGITSLYHRYPPKAPAADAAAK
jgi:hypothetical protein